MAEKTLKKSIGLWGVIATATGIVVASTTLVSMGQGFGIAGKGFVIAMLVAAILNLFVAFSFAELSSMVPRAGGINHYTPSCDGTFFRFIISNCRLCAGKYFCRERRSRYPGYCSS